MTLDEWCASLPATHRVRVELDAERAKLAAAVEALRWAHSREGQACICDEDGSNAANCPVAQMLGVNRPAAAEAHDRARRIEGAEAALGAANQEAARSQDGYRAAWNISHLSAARIVDERWAALRAEAKEVRRG